MKRGKIFKKVNFAKIGTTPVYVLGTHESCRFSWKQTIWYYRGNKRIIVQGEAGWGI